MPFPNEVVFDPTGVTNAVTNWPGSVVREKVVGYTAIDINGNTSPHSMKVDRDTDDGDIVRAWATAFEYSGASPLELRITRVYRFTDPDILEPLDDVQGSLQKVLTLTFRAVTDGREQIFTAEVPAPLAAIKDASGAFNPNSAGGIELIDDFEDIFDEANSAVSYSNATIGTRKLNGRQRQVRTPFRPQGQEDAGVDQDGA